MHQPGGSRGGHGRVTHSRQAHLDQGASRSGGALSVRGEDPHPLAHRAAQARRPSRDLIRRSGPSDPPSGSRGRRRCGTHSQEGHLGQGARALVRGEDPIPRLTGSAQARAAFPRSVSPGRALGPVQRVMRWTRVWHALPRRGPQRCCRRLSTRPLSTPPLSTPLERGGAPIVSTPPPPCGCRAPASAGLERGGIRGSPPAPRTSADAVPSAFLRLDRPDSPSRRSSRRAAGPGCG